MILRIQPPGHRDGEKRFAWWPIIVQKPETGGVAFLWMEPYSRRIQRVPKFHFAATIITTRLRTGQTFERYAPSYFGYSGC